MGCDIHFYVEVRKDGKWSRHQFEDKYKKGEPDADGYRETDYSALFEDPLYVHRNYDLFSILADVRNGTGFAGVDTGDGFVPISMPKGVPDDVSPEVMEEFVIRDDDGSEYHTKEVFDKWVRQGSSKRIDEHTVTHPDWHSASHFTVAELLAYDWDRKTKKRGWVDPWNFELFRKNGRPENWSGGISGGRIEHVTNQHLARLIDSGDLKWEGPPPGPDSFETRPYSMEVWRNLGAGVGKDLQSHYVTLVEWEVPYRDRAGEFLEKTLPALQALGNPDDVRIVFWFDN